MHNGENKIQKFPALRYGGPETEFYQESLVDVSYADVTGDGKEEAIVTVEVEFNRWYPLCIFVFSEDRGKAKLLWAYELNSLGPSLIWRGHKVVNNNLVVEEYDMGNNPSDCCPKRYFRKVFAWDGKTFQEKSREIIPYGELLKTTGFPSDNSTSN